MTVTHELVYESVIIQRLGSATLPFTVLSLAIDPCAEDYLAVCGLKVWIAYYIIVLVTYNTTVTIIYSLNLLFCQANFIMIE